MLPLLDNTVLSNFAIVDRVDLLRTALEYAATVPQVIDEFHAGVLGGRVPQTDWSWLSVLNLTSEEQEQYVTIASHLNQGEAACLAVASQRGG
jgi:predicted nucleic acid-binding protein